ncbi:MAG: molybdate ABC transporter substrate-binding protein [Clostridia bacterium]|nr:molybdate ABC transporter substrate-binding protein [Clostridia bacterium]
MKKRVLKCITAVLTLAMAVSMTACGAGQKAESAASAAEPSAAAEAGEWTDLTGKILMVYCGAAMKEPVTQITEDFKQVTGCEVEVTFGNGANIQSQIQTTKQGDVFIAGAATELKAIQEAGLVSGTKDLVQHIPVIAVAKGNPANIKSIADLANARLVLGDPEATPIGKIADAVLKDAGITDKVNIIARTSTAPEMITALSTGEADAAILWQETAAGKEGVESLEIDGMEKYIKTIPAASLSCTESSEALAEFLKYLDSDEAHAVWEASGYVIVE